MVVDTTVLSAIAAAGFLIGFGKAGVAGTMGPLATVLVVLVLPAEAAIGVLLPMMIIGDGFSLVAHWRRWKKRIIAPLLIASVVGIGLGSFVLYAVDDEILGRIIGVLMLGFVGWFAWARRPRIASPSVSKFGWLSGFASGLTSTLAHVGGPPLVVYLMSANLGPVRLVGTTVVFFAFVNLLKVPGYLAAGVIDIDLVLHTMVAWVLIPVGVLVGRAVVHRIPKEPFERLVLLLLAIAAIVMLIR